MSAGTLHWLREERLDRHVVSSATSADLRATTSLLKPKPVAVGPRYIEAIRAARRGRVLVGFWSEDGTLNNNAMRMREGLKAVMPRHSD